MTEPAEITTCRACGIAIPAGTSYCSAVLAAECYLRQCNGAGVGAEQAVAIAEQAAANGHARVAPPSPGAVELAAKVMATHVPVPEPCAHVYALGASACRLCGHSDAPKVYTGASTALQQQLDAARKRIAELERNARDVIDQRDKLIDEWQAEAERLRARVEELEAAAKMVWLDHGDTLARVSAAFVAQNREIEAERGTALGDATVAAARLVELQDELGSAIAAANELIAQRDQAEAERDAAREQRDRLAQKLARLRSAARAVHRAHGRLGAHSRSQAGGRKAMSKLSKEALEQIRARLRSGHAWPSDVERDLRAAIGHIAAIEAERAADPVRLQLRALIGVIDGWRRGDGTVSGVALEVACDLARSALSDAQPSDGYIDFEREPCPGERCRYSGKPHAHVKPSRTVADDGARKLAREILDYNTEGQEMPFEASWDALRDQASAVLRALEGDTSKGESDG